MVLDFFVSDFCEKSFQRGDFLASVHCRWYGALGFGKRFPDVESDVESGRRISRRRIKTEST